MVAENKVVLITGGTGSFGRATARHLLARDCRELRIYSRDEAKQDAMRHEFHDRRLRFYVGDVRDRVALDDAMKGVDFVFHAAALKQVPSCEFFPIEAIKTNVQGSDNVLDAGIAHGVERIVCLSTDKAVEPVNAMGMTKALMEKLVQARARRLENRPPVICCVRYGNVMYSRGSVIPLFVQQARRGETITMTSGDMTRFLLSLSDAVGLVEVALSRGRSGDVLVRKSPACTVEALAEAIKRLFRSDSPIETIGVRHGEKIHETLITFRDMAVAVDLGDYYRVPVDHRDLSYWEQHSDDGNMAALEREAFTSASTRQLDVDEVVDLLLTLPEIRRELDEVERERRLVMAVPRAPETVDA